MSAVVDSTAGFSPLVDWGLLGAGEALGRWARPHPLYITHFKCGAGSFLKHILGPARGDGGRALPDDQPLRGQGDRRGAPVQDRARRAAAAVPPCRTRPITGGSGGR